MIDRRLIGEASTPARAASPLAKASTWPRWLGACALALAACASGETPGAASSAGAGLGALAQPLSAAGADAGDPSVGNSRVDAGDAAAGPDDPGQSNDCCTTSSSGGCNDAAVAACVCEGDPFCCSTEFDALCVNQAVSRCGQDCDDRPPESDCCSASSVPGCTDAPVAACICEIDPFCCVFRFDQSCVNLGVARCNLGCEEVVP
jgi:hypothetical protein